MELTRNDGYQQLLEQISNAYTQGQVRAVQGVNVHLVEAYWQVGRHIVEYEQAGQLRAEYGKALVQTLAADLSLRHGKGFSRSNLTRFRQFYLAYPISATLSHQLTWSHIVELLKIDDPLERGFYEQQSLRERWSVRELIRPLYPRHPISQKPSHQLSWSQRLQLLKRVRRRAPAARAGAGPAQGGAMSRSLAAVQGDLDRTAQRLTGRIRELAGRSASPLPQPTDEVAALGAQVEVHVAKTEASWK